MQGRYLPMFCNTRLDYFYRLFIPLQRRITIGDKCSIIGHYFIVWLMLKKTFFTVEFMDPSSEGFQDAVSVTVNGVSSGL